MGCALQGFRDFSGIPGIRADREGRIFSLSFLNAKLAR